MVRNLSESNSIVNEYLWELRDVKLQHDRLRFRRNMERLGEILAYEISKDFHYRETTCQTPLAPCTLNILMEQPVLITILRAGIPFLQGFINVLDKADVGFVGAYRKEVEGEDLSVALEYKATPSIDNKIVVVVDPMLATGKSLVRALENLLTKEKPAAIHVASLIAAQPGIELVTSFLRQMNIQFSLWTCALDKVLNEQFYIVPGLGDAGDLSFGFKQH